MKSAMCSGNHHVDCQTVYQQPSGKKFRCDCTCHAPVKVYKPTRTYEDDDDDDYD